MNSTTNDKQNRKKNRIRLWAVLVWLLLWQLGAALLGQEILLVSPVSVLRRLQDLIITIPFWKTIGFSTLWIASGFLLGTISGILLGGLSSRYRRLRELLAPLVLTVKTIPVASFIILILIWISSRNLSVLISFLMVFPIIYTGVLEGIQNTDTELLEMARVFRMPAAKQIQFIYIFQALPFFRASCAVALGLCWKAGVAAELIGIPSGSIGERLYQAKIYLETPDLFAWTVVIILISVLFEKIILLLIDLSAWLLERT